MKTEKTFVVIDPSNGLHVRMATQAEILDFLKANPQQAFERPTKVDSGAVVDSYFGPGMWHGGAGF